MLVKNHQLITKFVTIRIGAKIADETSRYTEILTYKIIVTYHKSD